MKDEKEIYFEIVDSGNIVRLELIKLINKNSKHDWDRNWIITKVTIKGGAFSGQYNADFMTVDFEKFNRELSSLYDNLNGTANFKDLEDYLELKIIGDGLGHFEVDVIACDQPGIYGSELKFKITFDQTQIKELVNQLDLINKEFPVTWKH
jgi:hypothetical protein